MSEYDIGNAAVLGVIGGAIYCWFWMLGGRSDKWLRRYVGATFMGCVVNCLALFMGNWNPWMLCVIPALMLGSSMGYEGAWTRDEAGKTILYRKVLRRFTFTLGMLIAGLIMAFLYGGSAFTVFYLQIGASVIAMLLGIFNPVHAAAEEVFVCLFYNILLCTYPFVV